jgi:hypothetical protein
MFGDTKYAQMVTTIDNTRINDTYMMNASAQFL